MRGFNTTGQKQVERHSPVGFDKLSQQ